MPRTTEFAATTELSPIYVPPNITELGKIIHIDPIDISETCSGLLIGARLNEGLYS